MLLIAGCGGGGLQGDNPPAGGGDGGGGGGGDGGGGGSGDGDTTVVRIGHIDGSGNFIPGALFVRTSPLAAGGNTEIVANLADANGNPIDGSQYAIAFNSGCAAQNTASITSPVTPTTAGLAIATYTAKSCEGADAITATVAGRAGTTATGTVTVQPITLGTIQFDSAQPTVIAPKGTGGTTTGVVRFKVLSKEDAPVPNREVTFALANTAGGVEVTPSSISNSEGIVEAIVTAGNVITPVQVIASIASPALSTTYKGMRVGSGSPDQDSFSISLSKHNPEAWQYDGEEVDVVVRLADVHNNRVPDGTVVAFITDGGSIDTSESPCVISNGACTTKWISQSPRPADGLARIIAYAAGDESFTDVNGNGLFNVGEPFLLWDMGEPYIDENGNGVWDSGERFVDADQNGVRTLPNGLYDGALCADRANRTDCGNKSTLVWEAATLSVSGSFARLTDLSNCKADGIAVTSTTTKTCEYVVSDDRGNSMPGGTTISATVSNGTVSPGSYTVLGNTTEPTRVRFDIKGDTTSSTGKLEIKVTTPKGNISNFFDQGVITD